MKDGAHTHGHGGPDLAPVVTAFVVAALVLAALRWVAARPWWQLAAAAAVLVLAAAGALRARLALRRMKAADLEQITARVGAARAAMNPQVTPPAVEQHVHYHVHLDPAAPETARVIRAIPGTARDAISEGK